MSAIIAYGSLINPAQLCASYPLTASYPVVVSGYRRAFNQEPSWRKGDAQRRAVLNAVPSNNDCFNALLINLQGGSDFRELDKREKGYDRTLVDSSRIARIDSIHRPLYSESSFRLSSEQIYLYVGKPDKRNNDILPNEDYLTLCLHGARYWGKAFYKQFLQTTYVGSSPLNAFLQRDKQPRLR